MHSLPTTSHPVFLFSSDLQAMPILGQQLGIDWGEARHLYINVLAASDEHNSLDSSVIRH